MLVILQVLFDGTAQPMKNNGYPVDFMTIFKLLQSELLVCNYILLQKNVCIYLVVALEDFHSKQQIKMAEQ